MSGKLILGVVVVAIVVLTLFASVAFVPTGHKAVFWFYKVQKRGKTQPENSCGKHPGFSWKPGHPCG